VLSTYRHQPRDALAEAFVVSGDLLSGILFTLGDGYVHVDTSFARLQRTNWSSPSLAPAASNALRIHIFPRSYSPTGHTIELDNA